MSAQPGTGLWFRHGDPRFPFAWEGAGQPPARWHAEGEGPACYLADTPDGAWAEFLRHEEITDVEDLADVRRRIWAVEVDRRDVDTAARPDLALTTLRGGPDTYEACRDAARRLRSSGATVLRAPSAALVAGGAGGEHLRSGMVEGDPRDGEVLVVYGSVMRCRVWAVVDVGSPTARTLSLVEPL